MMHGPSMPSPMPSRIPGTPAREIRKNDAERLRQDLRFRHDLGDEPDAQRLGGGNALAGVLDNPRPLLDVANREGPEAGNRRAPDDKILLGW